MATVAVTLPRARRRPQLAGAGRPAFPEIYFVKQIDNSRLEREIDRGKRRECFLLLGVAGLVLSFTMIFAWQHFRCLQNGYQIEELKKQRAILEESSHRLRLEQAALADPQRIDTLARTELGLASPAPRQVVPVGGFEPSPAEGPPEFARNISTPGRELPREP
jgi:cell division protein FtsL